MALVKPLETLADLLGGEGFGEAELLAFIAANPDEGQWHDFKSGKIGQSGAPADVKKLKNVIRQYVTAFANSEGGILIVGVDESRPRKVDGFSAHGSTPLREWANSVLAPVYPQISPRIEAVTVAGGAEVLVIAVNRSPSLVNYIKDAQIRYAMRFGDRTVDVPEFLISDLVLGRRQHPILEVRDLRFEESFQEAATPGGFQFFDASVSLILDSRSLATSRETRVGAIAWTVSFGGRNSNPILRHYVDAEEPPTEIAPPWGTTNFKPPWELRRVEFGSPFDLPPFASRGISNGTLAQLPRWLGQGVVNFALFVLPAGSPPQWFEASLRYQFTSGHGIQGTVIKTPEPRACTKVDSRPLVAWRAGE